MKNAKIKKFYVLILAAGYATRLYPLTKHWPKPLLLVKEKPIITHIVRMLDKIDQISEILVVTNDKFIFHFKEWAKNTKSRHKITVISDETTSEKNRLGAIGDIDFILKKHKIDKDLLVIGGDNLFVFDLKKFVRFAQTKNTDTSVGLYNLNNPELIKNFGVVTLDETGRIINFQEKPQQSDSTLISMCIYYLPQKNFKLMRCFITEGHQKDAPGNYIKWLYKRTPTWGFKFSGTWYDIGDIITFYHASVTFKDSK